MIDDRVVEQGHVDVPTAPQIAVACNATAVINRKALAQSGNAPTTLVRR